jgi:hypothetical protein
LPERRLQGDGNLLKNPPNPLFQRGRKIIAPYLKLLRSYDIENGGCVEADK